MAIKTCAVTALVSGEAVTLPETTAITAADTVTITGGSDAARLLILLNNTTAAAKEFTIKAGDTSPPSIRKGLGDKVITVPEKVTQAIVVESARHANKDGTISITFQAGTTGFISAFRIPKAT
jgi:hypothetical protein